MSAAILLSLAVLVSQPDDFDTFFAHFAEKRAGIQILEADLSEESTQYGDIVARTGHVVFGRPKRFILRYGDDAPSMMIDGGRIYEYDPQDTQLQIYAIGGGPEASILFLGFDTDAKALKEAYDVRLFSIKDDQGTQGITIRPFQEDMNSASFQEVSIYFREKDYLPYRIEIVLDEDNRTVNEFSNYTINNPDTAARSQLRIPEGTRVIEDGEVTIREVPAGGILMPEEPLATTPTAAARPAESAGDQLAPIPPVKKSEEPNAPGVQVQELPAP